MDRLPVCFVPVRRIASTGRAFVAITITVVTLAVAPHLAAQRLNDTGATECFDASGSKIACSSASAADDGRFGRDAAATTGYLRKTGTGRGGFDFTKIANDGRELAATATLGSRTGDWACTHDNVTGLTWEVKTFSDQDFRSRRQRYTWYNPNSAENGGDAGSREVTFYSSCQNTLDDCNTDEYLERMNALAVCGFRDWRLPTPGELRGIVDYSLGPFGQFNQEFFTPHDPQWPSPHYWTSATYSDDPADGWLVEIGGEADGGGGGHHHRKGEEQFIVAVRGGSPVTTSECGAAFARAGLLPSTPTLDFIDHGDGTATHTKTGLMWKRCAEGQSGSDCGTRPQAGLDAEGFVWSQALARAESSTFAGYDDWRIPNLKELYSIVEHCGRRFAVNQVIFPNTPSTAGGAVFWTSTPDPVTSGSAMLVAFEYGGAVPVNKGSKIYVRLVRSGGPAAAFDTHDPMMPGPRRRSVRH